MGLENVSEDAQEYIVSNYVDKTPFVQTWEQMTLLSVAEFPLKSPVANKLETEEAPWEVHWESHDTRSLAETAVSLAIS